MHPSRTVLTLVVALAVAFVSCLSAPSLSFGAEPAMERPASDAAAAEVARELFERTKVPALAVAVVHDGEIVFRQTLGYANLEHEVPADEETLFRLGSISKLVTVAAMARLIETGKLDPGAPISRYTDAVELEDGVTAERLASHTAGIRHYAPRDLLPRKQHLFEHPEGYATLEDGLFFFAEDPLAFEPGTKYGYSSYGYNLLGVVLEGAGGESFNDLLRSRVLEPLAIDGIQPDWRHAVIPDRTAFYYANPETGAVQHELPTDSSFKFPSGGLLGTSEAVAKLLAAFLEPGFFKGATLEKVFTPQPNAGDGDMRVGLGWRIQEDAAGRPIIHHGGAIAGGRAFVLGYPEEDLGVVLLANSYSRFGFEEAQRLAEPFLP